MTEPIWQPTPEDWKAWYAHTSNKERFIEQEESNTKST